MMAAKKRFKYNNDYKQEKPFISYNMDETTKFSKINLSGFEAREEALKNIKRYVDEHTTIMYYRTTDWQHSWRVFWHVEKIIPLTHQVYPGFNGELTRRLALVHDDLEMITNDVTLYRKEQMSQDELQQLRQREQDAIAQIAARFPFSIDGYPYREMLQMVHDKKCLEARVVSYCDKFDGFGEALHEVFAGNSRFLRPVQGNDKTRGYIGRLKEFEQKYPELQPLLQQNHPLFRPTRINFDQIAMEGNPFTRESVVEPTGYAPYDWWKLNIINYGGMNELVEQKEFETEESPL